MAQQEYYQGLARKWRPQRFEDLVGQEAVAQSFQSALRQGRVVHGHLLAGPRGVGKTTSARILAKALNCEQGPTPTPCGQCRHCIDIAAGTDMDVIEIDAASNNSVDDVRELRERVIQAPFSARYKVYIIDEVHMLSNAAFNALLKTLEEPPRFVVFIFATTEIEKVPETIRSRCVVHTFRRLGAEDVIRRLDQVAQGEGAKIDPANAREIYELIARSVEGGMRDALVVFDQLIALTEGKPDLESATRLLGLADQATLTQTVAWLAEGKGAELLQLIEELVDRGRSLERFVKSLIAYMRDLMLLQAEVDPSLVPLTGEPLAAARAQARSLPTPTLYNILNQLFELEGKLKQSSQTRFLIEFTFLRIAAVRPVVPIDDILRRVSALPEAALGEGSAPAPAAPAKAPRTSARTEQQAPPARVIPVSSAAPDAAGPQAAVLHDSAPAAAPAPSDTPVSTGATADEILEALVPQLPDVFRFLGRYLRQASALRLEENGLRVFWNESSAFPRRMIEHPDNAGALEATLTQIHGRTMRIFSESAPMDVARLAAASAPEPRPAESPASPPLAHAQAILADSAAPWADPEAETPAAGDPAPLESEAEEGDAPAEFVPSTPAADPKSAPPAAPVDRRSPLQKAQALLAGGDDAVRRVRLLRDMLKGQVIDDTGQPLTI